jgi:hypothetical protein
MTITSAKMTFILIETYSSRPITNNRIKAPLVTASIKDGLFPEPIFRRLCANDLKLKTAYRQPMPDHKSPKSKSLLVTNSFIFLLFILSCVDLRIFIKNKSDHIYTRDCQADPQENQGKSWAGLKSSIKEIANHRS